MYDTTPLAPFKGETKPFLHVGFDNKTLESLFDLHPSFETSLDLSDYVTGVSHHPAVGGGGGGSGGCGVIASPHSVPDSAVVTSPVPSSPADLLTLSSAATSQHLAEIERQQPPAPIVSGIGSGGVGGGNNSNNGISSSAHHHHHQHHQHHNSGAPHFLAQPPHTSPSPVVPSTPSPVSHHHHHHIPQQHHHHHHHHQQHQQQQHHQQQQQQQQQLQGGYHQPVLSPSLSIDEVSQALSDDSCVFMPEYEQLTSAGAGAGSLTGGTGVGGQWVAQQDPFYNPVKSENMGGLTSLTTCSLEASLPGFTSSSSSTTTTTSSSSHHHPHHHHPHHAGSSSSTPNTAACKMEYESVMMDGGHYSGGATGMGSSVSPSHSMRTLSESSTATTSTMPDSPGLGSGSRRESGSGRGWAKAGSKRRQVPKGSEEYKEKRARNNVAVRKSRAKAKEKQRMTESRVKELVDLNESLQKKVEILTKELTVLRRLFVDVGATLPDDLSKLLGQQS